MSAASRRDCLDLLSQGWCVQVVEDVSAEVVRGYWIYERPASELDVLVGSDLTVRRRIVHRRVGPKLIAELEEFRTFDVFSDAHNKVTFGPGPGVRQTRLRHYRMRRA